MYRALFRHVLVHTDPERAHDAAHALIALVGRTPGLRGAVAGAVGAMAGRRGSPRAVPSPRPLPPPVPPGTPTGRSGVPAGRPGAPGGQEAWLHEDTVPVHLPPVYFDRELPGRLGLAAGFDKDASAVAGLTMLGFAFVEVGTITARAQDGNDKPRSWRIPARGALRNRMGFNNPGAAAAARTLRALRRTRAGREAVVGVNIGKSRITPPERAPFDYAASARLLAPWADYLVVNVSSPNTPGLRDLQAVDALRPILTATRTAADAAARRRMPLLVKIAPDLSDEQVREVADLVGELDLTGVVAVNTTIDHDYGPGGLSGPPLLDRGLAVVRLLRERLGVGPVVIGVGGISSVADALAYRRAGADLVQAFTAFIYNGPVWPARVAAGLAAAE